MSTYSFLFMPNGVSVSSLKAKATLASHRKQYSSKAKALDSFSLLSSGMNFKKALQESYELSPRINDGILYVPMKVDTNFAEQNGYFYYYIAVTTSTIALSSCLFVDVDFSKKSNKLNIHDLTILNFTKLANGWLISFDKSSLKLTVSDLGIKINLHHNGELSDFYEEFIKNHEIIEVTNNVPLKSLPNLSLFEISLKKHLYDSESYSVLNTMGKVSTAIVGCYTFEVDKEKYNALEIIKYVKSKGCSVRQFKNWLLGGNMAIFSNIKITSFPHFQFYDGDGRVIGSDFYNFPNSLSRLSKMISKALITNHFHHSEIHNTTLLR